jgi:hypothetical protein
VKVRPFAALGILLMGLAFIPSASATVIGTDNFDDATGAPASSWYTWVNGGAGTVVDEDCPSEPNCYRQAGAFSSYFALNADACLTGNMVTASFKVLIINGGPALSGSIHFADEIPGSPANGAGLIFGAGNVQAFVDLSGPQQYGEDPQVRTGSIGGGDAGFFDVTMTYNCAGTLTLSASGTGISAPITNAVVVGDGTGLNSVTRLVVNSNGGTTYIDDLSFEAVVGEEPRAEAIFCSASGNEDFGYEYREGVASPDTSVYRFTGDASDFDYLAKSWAPGTKHVASYFAIQAGFEGVDSVFRSAFTAVSGTPSAVTKGNGLDTQQFQEHIEVRFLETGNDWNVRIFHVSDSNGVSSRTALGSAFVGGTPNNMEFYNFTVDTDTLRAYVTRTLLVGDNAGEVRELFPGGVALPAYWEDDTMRGHWFVGYATDTAFNNNADTYLDSGADGDSPLSTCIYNFQTTIEVEPNGDPGRVPPDTDGDGLDDLIDSDDDGDGIADGDDHTPNGPGGPAFGGGGNFFVPDGAALPPGFTASTYNFFLGLLLMFAVGAGFFLAFKANIIAGLAGLVMGFLASFAFGLFEVWMVLVVVVLAVALIFLRVKGSAAG